MKKYPSIPRLTNVPNINAHVFVKYDGSNIRAEWSHKRGWYKFGTRHQMIDKSDPDFGHVIDLFKSTISTDLSETLHNQWSGSRSFIVFCEYFGKNSFAGQHSKEDTKELKVFDINIHKQGFIGPAEFLEVFGTKDYAAKYLGEHLINQEYLDKIRSMDYIDDYHYEGVILKWGEKHNLQMAKIKTFHYLAELKTKFGEIWEKYE